MDIELWIFITTACLFSAAVGAIAGHVTTRWSMLRDLEEVAKRKDTAVEAAMGTAFELQRVSGEVKQVELYDQDAASAQVNLVERPSDNPVRCPDGGVCAYVARGMPNCDEQCAVLLADDDEAREFLAEIRPERLCDNRCGQPARWVWDDGVPHAACDQDVELWWPDGIDLLVVTDLTATGLNAWAAAVHERRVD